MFNDYFTKTRTFAIKIREFYVAQDEFDDNAVPIYNEPVEQRRSSDNMRAE